MSLSSSPRTHQFDAVATTALVLFAFGYGFWRAGWLTEQGAWETASIMALIVTAGLFYLRLPRLALGAQWHLPILILLAAARELDFDKRFIDPGILQLRLYTGDSPLLSKAIGLLVVALILTCVYRAVRRNGPTVLRALFARQAWAWVVVAGIASVIVGKSLDGLARKLAPLGIEISRETNATAVIFEESFEFGFAAALLIALHLWMRRSS